LFYFVRLCANYIIAQECERLSKELNLLRPRAEELAEQAKYFEGVHNMDMQQISMLQTQKNQIDREKEDLATVSNCE